MSPWPKRLATCFAIGWIPLAPGTAASLAALPFGLALVLLGWQALAAFALLTTLLGIWACGTYAKKIGVNDPSECVIDEVAGQWIALLPIAVAAPDVLAWRPYIAGFLLFRLFDMWKPWPVAQFERLPGGLGIMMDDVAAGLLAGLALYGIMAIDLV